MRRSFVLQTPNNYYMPRTLLVQEIYSDTVKRVSRPIIRNLPCASALRAILRDVNIHDKGRASGGKQRTCGIKSDQSW